MRPSFDMFFSNITQWNEAAQDYLSSLDADMVLLAELHVKQRKEKRRPIPLWHMGLGPHDRPCAAIATEHSGLKRGSIGRDSQEVGVLSLARRCGWPRPHRALL